MEKQNQNAWNSPTSTSQDQNKKNLKKIKTFNKYFPDFDEFVCQEVLENTQYNLQLAIEQLGGKINILDLDDEDLKTNINMKVDEPYTSYPQLGSNSSNISSTKRNQVESNQQCTFNPFSTINNASAWKGPGNNPSSIKLKPSKEVNMSSKCIKRPSLSEIPIPMSENRSFLMENYQEFYQKISSYLSSSINVLVLLRGASGAGKSYLAKILASEYDGKIVSADYHFTNIRGDYFFNRKELSIAHANAQSECLKSMTSQKSKVVIVDNTNLQMWEMVPYVKLALQFGYSIELLVANNKWSNNAIIMSNKNVHGVQFKTIKEQMQKFDKNITVKELIKCGTLELKTRGIIPAPLKKISEVSSSQQQRLNSLESPTVNQQVQSNPEEVIKAFDNEESIINILDDLVRMDSDSITKSVSHSQLVRQSSSSDESEGSQQVSSTSTTSKKGLYDIEDAENDNELSYTPEEKFFKSINKLQKSSSSGSDASIPLYLSNENIRHFDEDKENVTAENKLPHPTGNLLPPPPIKVLSAYDIDIEGIESSNSPVALHKLFPEIDSKLLDDIYKKCSGDLNWCAELLLADGHSMNGEVCNDQIPPEQQEIPVENEASSAAAANLPSCSNSNLSKNNGDDQYEYLRISRSELENFEESLDVQTILAKTEERSKLQDDLDLYNPIDGDDWQECFLDKEFTIKLMEIYSNPLENVDVKTLPDERFKIKIPPSLAFELYQLFVLNNLQEQKKIRARQLSGESTTSDGRIRSKSAPCSSTSRKNSNANLKPSILEIDEKLRIEMAKMREATNGCPNLQRIIDTETKLSALEAQRVSEIRSQINMSFSTKLVLGKLHSGFPTLDMSCIEELYLLNGLDYERTLQSLLRIYGEIFVPSGLVDRFPNYQNVMDEYIRKEMVATDSVHDRKKTKKSDLDNMGITELRGLATRHYNIREEYRQRCTRANQSKIPGTGIFYSQMQELHTSRMIEANNMAASKTVHLFNEQNADPNFLDLHCLFVKEATDAFLIFLHERLAYMCRAGIKKLNLTVITGRGKNSINNIAKIQNEVLKILNVQNIPHSKLVGHVLVHLADDIQFWRRDELRQAGCNIAKDHTNEYY